MKPIDSNKDIAVSIMENMLEGLSASRMIEILEAEKDGRCILLPHRNDELFTAVEVGLGYKLHPWQKAYILGASDYKMPGRCCGRTTAHILRLILNDGPAIHLYRWEELRASCDEYHGNHYYNTFKGILYDIYYKLSNPALCLKLREVYFNKQEASYQRYK